MHRESPVIDSIRGFNRFYTRHLGWLDERHLGSDLSLTDVRLLYELGQGDAATATDLGRGLGLDLGYVSRLTKRLVKSGLLSKTPSPDDARRVRLALTAKGRKTLADLESATRDRLAALLADIPPDRHGPLALAMHTIQHTLQGEAMPATVVLRAPRPGDLGWVIHRQARLYHEEYGWNAEYEGLVAGIIGRFVEKFDPARECCWIAERNGEIVGSVFVVRKSAKTAQLRMLYVEPLARGLGVGRTLVDECIAFARARRYSKMMLWTNSVLVSARKIYEGAGFELVESEKHHSFGVDLVGQNWVLTL